MTLQELYAAIGGDYEQATRVLLMDKLIDKHIRRLPDNQIFPQLESAGESMDPSALFESAHAIKGVCGNLGLVNMASAASELAEEFRPGNSRTMTDDQVKEKVRALGNMFRTASDGIRKYASEQG